MSKENQNRNKGGGDKDGNNKSPMQNPLNLLMIVVILLVISLGVQPMINSLRMEDSMEVTYGEFRQLVSEDKVDRVLMASDKYTFWLKEGVVYAPAELTEEEAPAEELTVEQLAIQKELESITGVTAEELEAAKDDESAQPASFFCAPINDASLVALLEAHGVQDYGPKYQAPMSPMMSVIFDVGLTFGLMLLLFWGVSRMMSKGGGMGGVGNVGKANAKVYMEKETGVTFLDVAGQDEAKESLEEIIDFLHNPKRYTEIGAKLPKGALLVGSPGTGKTLLAKAVAGEANVPFFSISGSDFVELYVGVGASRVRNLFKEAAKVAPCIVFIDEIDTIGRSRDSKYGGDSEREQTLNQLLAEMDGFDPTKGVIMLAATNRPEVLDKALLRPGRFDRRITVDRPNLAGRLATLRVHTKNIRLGEDVDLNRIAQATAGCVGADLANLVNEAALRAVRNGRKMVNQQDLLKSFEMVIVGTEKKGTVLQEDEKRLIAYHEVGHALVSAKQRGAVPVSKITIVPHTEGALGFTLNLPEEEKFLHTDKELLANIRMLLGGRAAEELMFDTRTSGAANDIERATETARRYVAMFGMSERFGAVGFAEVRNQFLDGGYGLNCAQETAAAIDQEIMKIISQCAKEAKEILDENRADMEKIAAYLLEKETITGEEMMAIIEGKDPEQVVAAACGTQGGGCGRRG
jgi:ATP-dependent metalloprotease FtsH